MENLKIKVNNEAESKEAQELFFKLGLGWLGSGFEYRKNRIGLIFTTNFNREDIITLSYDCDLELPNYKEVTLPELRKLAGRESLNDQYAEIEKVRQSMQKEYLVKTEDGEYCFIPKGQNLGPQGKYIEIPEGAEVAVLYEPAITNNRFGELFFWKDNGDTNYQVSERSACKRNTGWYPCKGNMLTTLDEFLKVWNGDCRIVWQRDAGLSGDDCVEPIAELSGGVAVEFDWGAKSTIGNELNQSDINYRAAKAFNEIKQANTLTEDDVRLVLELVQLVKVHG